MFRDFIILTCLALVSVAAAFDVEDASEFCFTLKNHRNPKDMYADADNCHNLIQCLYINATYAVGYKRPCPANSFFHEPVLSCIPEGDVPCVDRCLDDAVAAKGAYAGVGCSQFFICSNTGSYGMCCPGGTEFNEQRFSCDESETCKDPCEQTAPEVKTTAAPSQMVNDTVCIDSFGATIMTDGDAANAFHIIDAEGHSAGKTYCAYGTEFNLVTCRCDIESDATTPEAMSWRKAGIYQPFDEDFRDHSVHNIEVFKSDGADIEIDNEKMAVGTGSVAFRSGFLELPGVKTNANSRGGVSGCEFVRCDGPCRGGFISLPDTLICGFKDGLFAGVMHFMNPKSSLPFQFEVPDQEWNQMCWTFANNHIKIYINGQLVASPTHPGTINISHQSMLLGYSQLFGQFVGHMDEHLMTSFEMTAQEVEAHYRGDMDYLRDQGFDC